MLDVAPGVEIKEVGDSLRYQHRCREFLIHGGRADGKYSEKPGPRAYPNPDGFALKIRWFRPGWDGTEEQGMTPLWHWDRQIRQGAYSLSERILYELNDDLGFLDVHWQYGELIDKRLSGAVFREINSMGKRRYSSYHEEDRALHPDVVMEWISKIIEEQCEGAEWFSERGTVECRYKTNERTIYQVDDMAGISESPVKVIRPDKGGFVIRISHAPILIEGRDRTRMSIESLLYANRFSVVFHGLELQILYSGISGTETLEEVINTINSRLDRPGYMYTGFGSFGYLKIPFNPFARD